MNKRILGGLAAAAMLTGGFAFTTDVAQAATEQCPAGGVKDEDGMKDNNVVLAAGTVFCVKGSTGATGLLTADGSTTLFAYLAAAVDNGGGNDPDVSHYVVYQTPPPPPPEVRTVTPVEPGVNVATCDDPGTVVLPLETIGYDWVKQADGTYLAIADEGYVLEGKTTFNPGNLDKLTSEVCVKKVVVVVPTPPTLTPEVAALPPTPPQTPIIASLPPAQVAPAQAVAPAAAAPAQALPSTGIDGTGITAIIALLLTSLGGAALFAARRRDVTI